MSGVFEAHNKDLFSTVGLDIGEGDSSSFKEELKSYFDEFHFLSRLSDIELVSFLRKQQIDILVDLGGHTKGARTEILSRRVAPIQINYLGYPGTMGANFYDYILADSVIIPNAFHEFYTEKVVYLPDCFQANNDKKIVAPLKGREFYDLGEDAFVFGCFNQSTKFSPELFNIWMKILKGVDNSILWLIKDNQQQVTNLKNYAENNGVDPRRLIFADHLPYDQHLARYGCIDLVLDTFPFNGGTTTSDALWVGAPVLSCKGDAFAARMGASLLNSIGISELVVSDLESYYTKAVELASHPSKLSKIRHKLQKSRTVSKLFDTKLFTQNLEHIYVSMINQLHDGEIFPAITNSTDDQQIFQKETSTLLPKLNAPNSFMGLNILNKKLLHVGCGNSKLKHTTSGFNDGSWDELRFDIDVTAKPDIVGTMTDMGGVASSSIDAIFSSHNIEHLYAHEIEVALSEFTRVLKVNGFLVITCPDLQSVCELVSKDMLTAVAYDSPSGPITPFDILFGHRVYMAQGNLYMAHRCGFTNSVLRATLQDAGFKSIASMRRPNCFDLWAVATKSELEESQLIELANLHFPK